MDAAPLARMLGVARHARPVRPARRPGRPGRGDAARRRGIPSLRVITTGGTATAAGLMQSQRLRDTLEALRRQAEYVVIEAPSTSSSADAQSLASLADAAILAVELRRTRRAGPAGRGRAAAPGRHAAARRGRAAPAGRPARRPSADLPAGRRPADRRRPTPATGPARTRPPCWTPTDDPADARPDRHRVPAGAAATDPQPTVRTAAATSVTAVIELAPAGEPRRTAPTATSDQTVTPGRPPAVRPRRAAGPAGMARRRAKPAALPAWPLAGLLAALSAVVGARPRRADLPDHGRADGWCCCCAGARRGRPLRLPPGFALVGCCSWPPW